MWAGQASCVLGGRAPAVLSRCERPTTAVATARCSYAAAKSASPCLTDLDNLELRLLEFGRRYEQIAAPFQWKFTRAALTGSPIDSTDPPPKPPDHEYVGELPSQST